MTDFERWAKALALTESNDDPKAWGDSGLACGRWQMHPAWYHDWMPANVAVDASWDTVFRAALQRFWLHQTALKVSNLSAAMIFHLGAHAVELGRWDNAYSTRFDLHWVALGITSAS